MEISVKTKSVCNIPKKGINASNMAPITGHLPFLVKKKKPRTDKERKKVVDCWWEKTYTKIGDNTKNNTIKNLVCKFLINSFNVK